MSRQSHTLDSAAFKPKRVHLEHREKDLLGHQTVQTNDSAHNHRNQGYQKRYSQPQGMSHELIFLKKKKKKKIFFSKRQTTSTTQGWCFERSSSTENGFYSDASPGSICLIRRWRKGRCPGSSCLKSAFKFAKEFPIYMLSQSMLTTALKQELHSTGGRHWDLSVEGLWLRGIQLRDRARLQPPPSDYPHPLLYKRLFRVSAYKTCGSKRRADSFLTKVCPELESSGKH